MKTRSSVSIAGLAIALMLFLVALPAQAWTLIPSVNNFSFAGVNSEGKWGFKWDTVYPTTGTEFQFKGGGLSDVWVSIDDTYRHTQADISRIYIAPMQPLPGRPLFFRIRIKQIDDYTAWAELRLDSPPTS